MSKINIDDVRELSHSVGWDILSTEYINLKTEMEFKCPEGHSVFTTFSKFRETKENTYCPVCATNKYKQQKLRSVPKKNKNVTRVLGIDQASFITGWSLFDGDELITFGIESLTSNQKTERFISFKEWLINIIHNYNPDVVVFEDIFFSQSIRGSSEEVGVTTYKTLAEILGICELTCSELKVNYKIVPSSTWRGDIKITGKSRPDKKRSAQILIKNLYDVSVSEDEADAICIGLYGTKHYSKEVEMINWGK